MKVKTLFLIIAAIVLAFIILKSFLFVVDETQQAVVLQLKKPVRVILGTQSLPLADRIIQKYEQEGIEVDTSGPGLKTRIPFLQQVAYVEDMLLDYDDAPRNFPTGDKKRITIDNYTQWAIIDPLLYLRRAERESKAQGILDSIVPDELRGQVSSNLLYEMVRSSDRPITTSETKIGGIVIPAEIKKGREKIMQTVTENCDTRMREFGIKIVDVRIKRADLPQGIRLDVEKRMISERRRVENRLKSEGDEILLEAEGNIKEEVNKIISEAERQARALEGQADAEAIKIYAEAYSKDPEFFDFLRTLESYKKAIGKQTRLIISTDSDYFKLLKTLGGSGEAQQ